MATVRTAQAHWEGSLMEGQGEVELVSSEAGSFEVNWPSRAEQANGKTSPEELIAAAHSSCFSMALSNALAEGGHPAERLDVSATVTVSLDGGPRVSSSHITVRGAVPGIDADAFAQAVAAAEDGCPVSNALKGNVEITVDAQLS